MSQGIPSFWNDAPKQVFFISEKNDDHQLVDNYFLFRMLSANREGVVVFNATFPNFDIYTYLFS
jgi:hypothetical protein